MEELDKVKAERDLYKALLEETVAYIGGIHRLKKIDDRRLYVTALFRKIMTVMGWHDYGKDSRQDLNKFSAKFLSK